MTTLSHTLEWTPPRTTAGTWLISRAGDFWVACAGGGVLLVAMAMVLQWHGDRELDTADLLLSELHLGATYDAIARGRLWRRMPFDIIAVPIAIFVVTYVLSFGGYPIVITSAALYLGAWHRGRQNFGIARYYQARFGGPVSPWHRRFFTVAIYAPMIAGVLYFTGTSEYHEGEEYAGLTLDQGLLYALGAIAAACVAIYLAFALRHRDRVHPGERWLVTAQALSFGSAYVLGAWSVSFILILVVHHEVQYLYFTYAMARRGHLRSGSGGQAQVRPPGEGGQANALGELRLLASFTLWPLIGLGSWALCRQFESPWLTPFLVGGLLCHYWLDGRIWTSRARRAAVA